MNSGGVSHQLPHPTPSENNFQDGFNGRLPTNRTCHELVTYLKKYLKKYLDKHFFSDIIA